MKVLHMLQSNRFSGAENVVCQIISMCRNSNIEFIYSSQDGQIRDVLKEKNIEFYPIEKMSVNEFKKVIKLVKPDVIHAHDMGASFFAALSCGEIPLISHVHNNNFNSRRLSLKSLLYYIAAKKATHIFWVSQSSFDGYVLHKHLIKKSTVLYNIIDVELLKEKMFLDKNTYDYDLIYLGRLTYQKNPQRLIKIITKIVAKRPNTKVAIIGIGDLESETKEMSVKNSLDNNVDFLGFKSNPTKILHDSKVMIMTSRWEGTPMCALESLALGVPVVSTPSDGLCELIQNGVNGYLSNDDDELSQYIISLIDNNEKREKFSRNAVKISKSYNDINTYRRKIIDAYVSNRYQ